MDLVESKETIIMHSNIIQAINYFCTNEMEAFKKSNYYSEISSLSNTLGFSFILSVNNRIMSNKYPQAFYLGIAVADKQGETVIVDTLDYEHLSYATDIAKIDRNGRIIFRSWIEDEDFIETIEWIIVKLKNMVRQQTANDSMA